MTVGQLEREGVSLRWFRSLEPRELLALRHLHDGCHDSRLGFEEAIARLRGHPFTPRLRGWACDRLTMADLLEVALRLNAVVPRDRGTTLGALRRAWHHLSGAVSRGSDPVVARVARQEQVLLATYELELDRLGEVPYRATLESHLRVVQRTCEALGKLRDDRLLPVG
ncbi:MAG: DUF2383 domain-containing protein [Planctomycetota bacterium]